LNRRRIYFKDGVIDREEFFDVDWERVRSKRDKELANSDWRAVKDRVLPNEWKEYRQALRDITDHTDANAAADNWPVKPDA
jgi:hypothetical protein